MIDTIHETPAFGSIGWECIRCGYHGPIGGCPHDNQDQPTAIVSVAELNASKAQRTTFIRSYAEALMLDCESWDDAEDLRVGIIDAIRGIANPKTSLVGGNVGRTPD